MQKDPASMWTSPTSTTASKFDFSKCMTEQKPSVKDMGIQENMLAIFGGADSTGKKQMPARRHKAHNEFFLDALS